MLTKADRVFSEKLKKLIRSNTPRSLALLDQAILAVLLEKPEQERTMFVSFIEELRDHARRLFSADEQNAIRGLERTEREIDKEST